ncbi:MAG: carboxypeptidase-like regulatory domain-containing protein [Prevotella sp.]|nr:carboxypeptidase-like regulatory domain-containing protein [Prevotella sp.]
MNVRIRILLILFTFYLSLFPASAQQMLTGAITDAQTGEAIPFASVQYKGHNLGIVSNIEGHYSIARHQGWVLSFSAVGYVTTTVMVNHGVKGTYNIKLKPDNTLLKEVTVKAKRGRYSRKNNPAVEMMKKVIAAKKKTHLDNHDYYQYNKYQKLTLALNNITPALLDSPKYKKKQWLIDQVEPCPYNNKLILPVSVDETVSQKIYRKHPHDEKVIIKGMNASGINDLVQTGDILNTVMKDVFTDVDIYDDQIRMLQYPFTSPIGSGAISFYRFYIEDTLMVAGDKCFHLHFLPNNQQDFGFRGDLYILADSSWQVKRCDMTIPKKSDVNFVENMQIVQEFTKLPNGEWVLTIDDMFTELKLASFLQTFAVIRNTRITDYAFDELPRQLFKGKKKEVKDVNAMMRGDDFWKKYRQVELTKSESSMGDFIKNLEKVKGFKYIIFALKAFIENFVETGTKDHPSKVDIGPINTMFTSNFIDGFRTRLSAQTTANLDSNFFFRGYVARGWGSKQWYYKGDVIWSFNKKEYLPREFPIRMLTLSSSRDIESPSDKFLHTDKDNVFTAFKWATVDKMKFYNRQSLTFQREEDWGFRTTVELKTEENDAAGELYFIPLSESSDRSLWTNWSHPVCQQEINMQNTPVVTTPGVATAPVTPITPVQSRKFRTTELRAELRFAPGETFINTKQRRLPINLDAPVFTVSHTLGIKGLLGSDYSYNYTEASIYKRFWLRSWGKMDWLVKGGIQWEKVPYPLLIMPETNLSYIVQDYTFESINNMEFPTDRFLSAVVNWDLNGKIFNRIPLLKKLKWREWIAFRILWGDLSDKNNPFLEKNAGSPLLMYFPEGSYVIDSKRPYMELSLGIHNIFKIIHVEYVRRLNYNELPTAHKHGFRLMVRMTF